MSARIAFIVYYSEYTSPEKYVMYFLEKVRPLYDKVVLISNSDLGDESKTTLERYCDNIIIRENTGYDFAAWETGIKSVGWHKLNDYDYVTLMNTTCFGPIFPLEPIYTQMERDEIDFWGMTNFRRTSGIGWYPGGTIPEHIQSYFLSFRREVVQSAVFRKFVQDIHKNIERDDVIINYETKLTEKLVNAKYTYDVVFDTVDLPIQDYIDYSRYDAGACIDAGVPLIKIKAFIPENNRRGTDLIRYIQRVSSYPTRLITKYFSVHDNSVAQAITSPSALSQIADTIRLLISRCFRKVVAIARFMKRLR